MEPKAEDIQTEEKAAETTKAEQKKEPAKKTAKKDTVKADEKGAAKTTAKKTEQQCTLYVQYGGRSLSMEDLVKIAKDVWKYDLKRKAGDLKTMDLYVKPEENKVYYVMNKEFTGCFDI